MARLMPPHFNHYNPYRPPRPPRRITLTRLGLFLLIAASLMVGSCLSCGCGPIKAGIANLAVNPKTGQVDGQVEGATGNFYKNTGLNISAGSNGTLALALVCGTLTILPFVYPAQRSLRLWRQNRYIKEVERQRSLASSASLVSGPGTGESRTRLTPSNSGSETS